MALAQQKPISIGILWIGGLDVQLLPVERHQQLHAGEAGSQMGNLGGRRGGHEPLTQGEGRGGQFCRAGLARGGRHHGLSTGVARSRCRIHFTV